PERRHDDGLFRSLKTVPRKLGDPDEAADCQHEQNPTDLQNQAGMLENDALDAHSSFRAQRAPECLSKQPRGHLKSNLSLARAVAPRAAGGRAIAARCPCPALYCVPWRCRIQAMAPDSP